ncbi:tetratricopeptide repeat protein [Myxococcus sp. K38C18041901]|uniref:tetratricopeptide repeat protein n=1 Tax=Myxococcus guangdongensis TaxID=2906760 RepID=UPI0020A75EB1|nr:tetratricopeptide repeat protein [Myxococcus guangdongensis]MCP3062426.1 tetratricopeptide repeat protein [Myxococcus guangdongensis]
MTALSVASGLAWAGPKLAGPSQGDTYGPVDLHMEGERLVGLSAGSGGGCKFAPATEVLSGEFQGTVLVATVQLCLEGPPPDCVGVRPFTVLAVYNANAQVLSAHVRLPPKCHSPGLKDSVLTLRGVKGAEPVEREEEVPAAAPEESEASPAPVKEAAVARPQPLGTQPLELGQNLLANGKWEMARARLEAALAEDPKDVDALVGMAASFLGSGNAPKAVEFLERIRPVPASRPDVYAWQAYAADQQGFKGRVAPLLRRALELNWAPESPKPWEAVLVRALASDIEQVQKTVKKGKRAPGRESAGAGSSSP